MSALTASFVLTTVATGPSMMFTRVAPRSMCGSEASWSCSELPMSVRVGRVIIVLMMFTAEPPSLARWDRALSSAPQMFLRPSTGRISAFWPAEPEALGARAHLRVGRVHRGCGGLLACRRRRRRFGRGIGGRRSGLRIRGRRRARRRALLCRRVRVGRSGPGALAVAHILPAHGVRTGEKPTAFYFSR